MMFSLSICFGNTVWAFRFKTEAKAKLAYELISNPVIENLIIEDDFGQQACIKAASIHGFQIEDMTKTKEAHIAQLLHNSSVQQEATRRAQTQARSPSIVSPFPVMPAGTR